MTEIKTIQLEQEQAIILPLLQQLYGHLTEEKFEVLLKKMTAQGYRMIGLFVEKELIAIAGYVLATNFYDEQHLFLHDLVSDQSQRSKGYGKQLLLYLENLAVESGCQEIVLCSRLDRTEAHRFYEEKLNYQKTSYVIKRYL